ncbi:MAG: hypothetical protein H6594_06490 [Flavobacteriales bacterium]|nr:hypothetical protein [Flavobacteriales bacterium]
MRAYLIVIHPGHLLDGFNEEEFHKKLTTVQGLISWWHYLPNAYIILVADNINASGVSDYVRSIIGSKHFLVTRFDPWDHNGWLPKEAWDWINENRERHNLR